MINIHTTKKLHARLPVDDNGCLPGNATLENRTPASNPLNNWHANLITLQRHNCILLVHDQTRFPLFVKHLLKADYVNFQWHFEDALMNTLLKLGASQQQLDRAAGLLETCRFDTVCNRSVQGTMNQMAYDLRYRLWFDNESLAETNAYKVGAWLADRPCSAKRMKEWVWPHKAMFELLS